MKAIMISITPLDALQRLRQNNIDNTHLFDDKLFDIIEITLKENEYLKTELFWTDKGLIYVAKMNEKGELELYDLY